MLCVSTSQIRRLASSVIGTSTLRRADNVPLKSATIHLLPLPSLVLASFVFWFDTPCCLDIAPSLTQELVRIASSIVPDVTIYRSLFLHPILFLDNKRVCDSSYVESFAPAYIP